MYYMPTLCSCVEVVVAAAVVVMPSSAEQFVIIRATLSVSERRIRVIVYLPAHKPSAVGLEYASSLITEFPSLGLHCCRCITYNMSAAFANVLQTKKNAFVFFACFVFFNVVTFVVVHNTHCEIRAALTGEGTAAIVSRYLGGFVLCMLVFFVYLQPAKH